VPFLVVLPNDFLDAVSCPEDVDNSTVYIFFLIDFTPERGVIPLFASGILQGKGLGVRFFALYFTQLRTAITLFCHSRQHKIGNLAFVEV
jgi:hypothetical protein